MDLITFQSWEAQQAYRTMGSNTLEPRISECNLGPSEYSHSMQFYKFELLLPTQFFWTKSAINSELSSMGSNPPM